MAKFTVQDIIDKFKYELLVGADNLSREIKVYGINRPGLELAGFDPEKDNLNRRVILLSNKEQMYVQTLSEEIRRARYEFILNENIPLVILTEKFTDPLLLEIARTHQCPVARATGITTSRLYQTLLEYFDEYFSPTYEEHGSLINIFGKGVLLIGKSGIGKSEITLELVKKNHLFVGDDRIVIQQRNNKLFGRSHEILKNLIEVRGLGILDLSKIYGLQILLEETTVDLVIELILLDNEEYKTIDRLGAKYNYTTILETKVPIIKIPVTYGRSVSELVETAVSKLKLEEAGFSSLKLLEQQFKKYSEE
ncbi:HPr kinase/phosphorylase [Spiroplasma syrphidicola EA-1]|uniref:HPr kinase/phosphorylase n=1 Tax=Spiroplasma syrphidicola EA-1 TaxID=1276229 RepID=R4U589_9MOLU|nr:HPr(Ser) kinase/phosphatase [Spiroplasma syrphidicola]AGM25738.1 HPr kinase/phosphorylase [Spiroplasma syrphidicola EA-1]